MRQLPTGPRVHFFDSSFSLHLFMITLKLRQTNWGLDVPPLHMGSYHERVLFLEFVLALVLVGYYGDWLLKNHRVPVAPLHAYAILQMEKENK